MRRGGAVVARAWLALSLLGGCGRLGFDALLGEQQADPDRPRADAGPPEGDGGGAGTGPGAMDAATADAAAGAGTGGGGGAPPPGDAGQDAGDSGQDAGGGDDEDAGSDPPPPSCPVSPITDYCAELPRLPRAAEIDGVLDCGLVAQPVTPVSWTVAPPIPADHAARLAAAWLPDGLYVYLDIDDTSRLPAVPAMSAWCGDGIEIYADADGAYTAAPAYDNPGTTQLIARAPANDTQSETGTGERWRAPMGATLGVWSSTRYAAFPRPGGYVFEAFIDAADLDLPSWQLQSGNTLGFDLAVNVSSTAEPAPVGESNDCGRRMGQFFLRVADAPCGNSCFPFVNVAAFCTPALRD